MKIKHLIIIMATLQQLLPLHAPIYPCEKMTHCDKEMHMPDYHSIELFNLDEMRFHLENLIEKGLQ